MGGLGVCVCETSVELCLGIGLLRLGQQYIVQFNVLLHRSPTPTSSGLARSQEKTLTLA